MAQFVPFTKIDAVQRRVYGSLTEDVDRAGEIFDYASSKPEFEKWSAEMAKASGGVNLGNVRSMHQRLAAGKLVEIAFDDMAKRIDLVAEIADDGEWQKCIDRVYTGFSPGGKFLRKWPDPDRPMYKRYTGLPLEVSLVDMPANPGATFTMVKAAGIEEVLPLGAGDELAMAKAALAGAESRAEYRDIVVAMDAACVGALYGESSGMGKLLDGCGLAKRAFDSNERKKAAESGAAMPDGSFPIEDKKDLAVAVEAHGRAKDKDAAETHITKRAKALGATDALPADWDGSTQEKAAEIDGMAKRGARHSKADLDRLQAIHDHAVGMGAACSGCAEKAAGAPDSMTGGKAAAGIGDMAKLAFDLAGARDDMAKLAGENAEMRKRIEAFERLPAPPKGKLLVVGKGEDVAAADSPDDMAKIAALPEEQQASALIRLALKQGRPLQL